MVSGDNVKLTLDGVKLVCNAAKTYAVNCLDGANPDVTLSNSEIIALGTDCRAVSVVNTRATSDTSYITFDNTQARRRRRRSETANTRPMKSNISPRAWPTATIIRAASPSARRAAR